ncbi:MAG: hypothetical protein PW791_08780 [Neorhizobium sp.]|jgi:hypothetical protein|nr:hypothetical protein [Neorhizobium sp.]
MKIVVSAALATLLATASLGIANAAPAHDQTEASQKSSDWHAHAPAPAHHKGQFVPS